MNWKKIITIVLILATVGIFGLLIRWLFKKFYKKNDSSCTNCDDGFHFDKTVQYGDDSCEVAYLQYYLNDTFDSGLKIDGKFGSQTNLALEQNNISTPNKLMDIIPTSFPIGNFKIEC